MVSITRDNYAREIAESTQPIVIDVYATWCGPCQYMTPIFEEIAKENSAKYKFVKLNVDEARDVSMDLGITSVPTFVFIDKNEIKGKETGAMSKDDFLKALKKYLG